MLNEICHQKVNNIYELDRTDKKRQDNLERISSLESWSCCPRLFRGGGKILFRKCNTLNNEKIALASKHKCALIILISTRSHPFSDRFILVF